MLSEQHKNSITLIQTQKDREHEMWANQRRWEATRTTYRQLCTTVRELEASLVRQKACHEALRIFAQASMQADILNQHERLRIEMTKREDIKRMFRESAAFAPVDVGSELDDLLAEIDTHLAPTDRTSNLVDHEIETMRTQLEACRGRLIELATVHCVGVSAKGEVRL
jgi:hypothetical protein